MVRHIGIVGCSAEGAALCYRTICEEGEQWLGNRYAHPEVSLHTFSFAEYMRRIEAGDWPGVADLMVRSAEKLARVGADFAISPDNTIHQAFAWVEDRSPIPWLHIAREVVREARRRGYRRLGILGTRFLMESSVYPEECEKERIAWEIPPVSDRKVVHRVIFKELVYGKFRAESRRQFYDIMAGLKGRGCDAVVLGCTEIPLLVIPDESPLPVLDSTRILARAALRKAVGEE